MINLPNTIILKLALLPKQVFIYYYPEALLLFIRSTYNLLLYLEEDLAVGLMFRRLFIPLYHDASLAGKITSCLARFIRVTAGFFAMLSLAVLMVILAITWFILPVLVIVVSGEVGLVLRLIFGIGIISIVFCILVRPIKKVSEVKDVNEIWQCTTVNLEKSHLSALIDNIEVANYLTHLEQNKENFIDFPQTSVDQSVFETALELAKKGGFKYVSAIHLFIVRLLTEPSYETSLAKVGLNKELLVDAANYIRQLEDSTKKVLFWNENFHTQHLKGVNWDWMGSPTPILDSISEDLTLKAARQPIPELLSDLNSLLKTLNLLSSDHHRSVILIGESSIEKQALVLHLAKRIISKDVPEGLAIKRLVKLDVSKLIYGVKTHEEVAVKINAALREAKKSGKIIIYIDDAESKNIDEANKRIDVLSLIIPCLRQKEMQFIVSARKDDYQAKILQQNEFAMLFTRVNLSIVSEQQTRQILISKADEIQKSKGIKTTFLAMDSIVQLCNRSVQSKVLPDSALELLDDCILRSSERWITKKVVGEVVLSRSGIKQ